MSLADPEIEQIEAIVKRILQNQLPPRYDLDLVQRIVKVEEELKHQRELMQQGFALMEKRFEQVDKRFEQVDKRFEQIDKRFDQIHQEIMAIHQEIKQLMKWGFGLVVGVAGLIIAAIRLMG